MKELNTPQTTAPSWKEKEVSRCRAKHRAADSTNSPKLVHQWVTASTQSSVKADPIRQRKKKGEGALKAMIHNLFFLSLFFFANIFSYHSSKKMILSRRFIVTTGLMNGSILTFSILLLEVLIILTLEGVYIELLNSFVECWELCSGKRNGTLVLHCEVKQPYLCCRCQSSSNMFCITTIISITYSLLD